MQVKQKRELLQPRRLTLAVAAAFMPWTPLLAEPGASQLPTGGNVAAGSVAISTTGTKMQIDQSTDKAIINWNCFCIGSNAWVNFSQPSASSVVLNRSTQAAEIFGRMSANGQVFVTSGAGVYFGRTAQVDVGGLMATSLSIRDQDFLAGRYIFSKDGSAGEVVNDGRIVALGGYAALAGPQVRNNGIIIAQAGTVALAAGDRVSLDMIGDGLVKISVDAAALNALALNAGTLAADGGRVILTARSANALLDTVINNTGVIRATTIAERGGEIVLDGGSAGVVANNGSLDASGSAAGTSGGTVNVRGQHVYLAEGSTVDASGDAGGGTVVIKGSDTAYVYGRIDARGTGEGSNGGFVETSGHYLEVAQAPNVGAGGTWLIDPYNIEVVAGGGTTNNDGAPTFTPNGDSSQIGNDLINGQLNAGTNVVLDTGGAGSPGTQPGNITVNGTIFAVGGPPASLTLNANNDVTINAGVTTSGALNVTAGGNMTVNNNFVSGSNLVPGAQNINVAGNLSVVGNPGPAALMIANGGQVINAQSIDVRSQGGFAQISNQTSGSQTINVSGGSIDVQTLAPGGNAFIVSLAGNQTITIQNGDHLNVKANAGIAGLQATNGVQSISLGGSGANQINIGTFGAGGSSQVVGRSQDVTAGSINIDGSAVSNSTTGFITTNNLGGNSQTFNVAGTVKVRGGTAPNTTAQSNAGIFHNSNGLQIITAGAIDLQGGTGGNNNSAFISNSTSGGSQQINVSGAISVAGGAGGANNRAAITTVNNQTISAGGDVVVTGGAGTANNAQILGSGSAALLQTISTGNIQLTAGGGTDASATVTAARQVITASGDVTISGSPGTGSVNGARIGGNGGAAPSTTDLTLHVGHDLLVSGGSGSGASVGSTVTSPTAHTIAIDAGRDVILSAGTGGGVRIGTSFNFATPATGDIAIAAGRNIQLNAGAQSAAIRTSGNVNLTAGGSITENQFNAAITAAKLNTSSVGDTILIGDNRLGFYRGNTTAGNLALTTLGSVTIDGPVDSAGFLSLFIQDGLSLSASGTQDVFVTSRNGQFVSAQSLHVSAQDGRRAILQNLGAGNQDVSIGSGGIDLTVVGGAGVAQIINNASNGAQFVSTSGALNVLGGSAAPSSNSGIFLSGVGTGNQVVIATSGITLTAANTSINAGAQIGNFQGDQAVSTSGDLVISGGAGGSAGIFGALGRNQTVSANNISLTNAASGGFNSVGFILGSHQQIDAAGNVTLTSRASGGDLSGTRIGGGTNSTTDLHLNVGGNLVLTAGTAPNNGVGIGSSAAGTAFANDITISAGGDVILNAGSFAGSGARIGASSNGVPGGNIAITARDVQLNGGVAPAVIRTADSVTLNANGSIAENGNAFVQAGSLTTSSQFATNLGGANLVGVYNGSTGFGDLAFNNATSVNVTGGFIGGNASLTTTGADSDMTVTGLTTSIGSMTVNVAGDLSVVGSTGQNASLRSNAGQTIDAQSLLISATGGQALVSNNGSGNQTITISGGGSSAGVDVRTTGAATGLAQIENNAFGGTQTLTIVDGDHLTVNGAGPLNPFGPSGAGILANGNQTISVTGSGANAIRVGSSGALGTSHIRASGSQTMTAGTGTESGSITVVGPATNSAFTGIVTNAAVGNNTQTISTTGAIDVTAGSAPSQGNNFGTGIFHNRQGLQTINAGSITLRGGTGGSNNVAFISTNPASPPSFPGGRDQVINVTGDITILGSDAGSNNRAVIVANNGNQTINAGGDIVIRAGASGVSGTSNASIAVNTAGRQQTINARNIALSGPASGGIDSVASIIGTNQLINATGNVTLTAGGSGGTLAGVRIGGFGGASPSASNVTMNIGGDLVLTGGTAASNGVGIGSSAAGTPQANNIAITAGGDVILNAGAAAGAGARIGSASTNGVAGGDISISARSIQLNGSAQPAAIRTLGTVTLHADQPGGTISESGNGFVQGGTLITTSSGSANLVGPNQVGVFNGNSSAGDVSLANLGNLEVIGLSAAGAGTVANSGDVTVTGAWTSATASIGANGGAISESGSGAIQASTLTTQSSGATVLNGANQVSGFTGHADAGDISLRNTSSLLTLGTMDFSGSLTIDQTGALAVPGTVTALNQSISTTGDVLVGSASGVAPAGLFAPGTISITTPGSIVLRGSDLADGGTSMVSAGGLLTVNAGELQLTGGAAPLAAASMLGGELMVTSAQNIALTSGSGLNANALLYSGGNITMTIGGILTIDGGHSLDNWARVQTQQYDGTITLNFPNASSGGFSVDGVAGRIKHGQDGLFTADKPAKLGETLLINYGL